MTTLYFPRTLCHWDERNHQQSVDEAGLLRFDVPKIVLGEPGMGKSELMKEVGRRMNLRVVPASLFIHSRRPEQYLCDGKPLLIDGLDEAMTRQESETIDHILAQLDALGSPDFILTCRAREWQTRHLTRINNLYEKAPVVFSLQPLVRAQACDFLVHHYPALEAERVLDHLDKHGVSELYHNPLLLDLMGAVASRSSNLELPSTRSALFDSVVRGIWVEHNRDRSDPLQYVSEEQAFDCAGAMMAGMLLAGSEAISLTRPASVNETDIVLAELTVLPGAGEHAREIVSSKLFRTISDERTKPIHRVIAEFLAARWLTRQADNDRKRRRLLAQFQSTGRVPASFRGIHAWMAYHCPFLANEVIAMDPLGVLRYADTVNLSKALSLHLFESLKVLAQADPYFRRHDWDSHTAKGIVIEALKGQIEAVISSPTANRHLSSLLIDGLRDNTLAGKLVPALLTAMMDTDRGFNERSSAAAALKPYYSTPEWEGLIKRVLEQSQTDSILLARTLIERFNCAVSDELVVATFLAELGITVSALPRDMQPIVHRLKDCAQLAEMVPTSRLSGILTLLGGYASLVEPQNWQGQLELNELIAWLIARAIDERVVTARDPALLWDWLGGLSSPDPQGRAVSTLQSLLDSDHRLRRAVQSHVLYDGQRQNYLFWAECLLEDRLVGLRNKPEDVTFFVRRLASQGNTDPRNRQDWRDLMRLGRSPSIDAELRLASQAFQDGDAELDAFAFDLEQRAVPPLKAPRNKDAGKKRRILKLRFKNSQRLLRRRYKARLAELCVGTLEVVLNPARIYLGEFPPKTPQPAPLDRLVKHFGQQVAQGAMDGFEATLHRNDIPSAYEVARQLGNDQHFQFSFPVFAGLLARLRHARGFADLPIDVLKSGLMLCYHTGQRITVDEDRHALRGELERILLTTAFERKAFARLWIEPALTAGHADIPGIIRLSTDPSWGAVAAELASEWLARFPDSHPMAENRLIDMLMSSEYFSHLAAVAEVRGNLVLRNCDRLFTWLAIDVLVRFDWVMPQLASIGTEHPSFLWHLRDRFRGEFNRVREGVSVAQVQWIISQFRSSWPRTLQEDREQGEFSSYRASLFLGALIEYLAVDTSDQACGALLALMAEPDDGYSELIRHLAIEQQQKRTEEYVTPILPLQLAQLLADARPSNIDDLKALVLEELDVVQRKLIGDALDPVRVFWSDTRVPRDENICRDHLAGMFRGELKRYAVQLMTEVDMPANKRVDMCFTYGDWQLPVEVKGQWHSDVWHAATSQLDLKYLIDWHCEGRGIYCVLWFGYQPVGSGKGLRAPVPGGVVPSSAAQMRALLIEQIPPARRALISVVVLDFS